MDIKPGMRMKWRSTATKTRWFHGRVYSVSGKYALVEDLNGKMYPHHVALYRLMQPGAVET